MSKPSEDQKQHLQQFFAKKSPTRVSLGADENRRFLPKTNRRN